MRQGFVHEAVLMMEPGADVRAPGAAVTAALCGHWEHEPPCPVAPHHSQARRVGAEVHLRVLFATEPELESTVRQRIARVLSGGQQSGPDGMTTRWRLHSSNRSDVTAAERDHAQRLASS